VRDARRDKLKLVFSSLILVGITTAIIILGGTIRELGSLGYIGLAILAAVSSATFIFPGPSAVGVILGGMTLNPWILGPLMGLGSALGELPGYYAGAANVRSLQHIPGGHHVQRWMNKHSAATIFVLAAVPNYLFDVGSVLAGAFRMPVTSFLAATVAGKVVRFTGVAVLASSLGHLFGKT
jgi:membrane protein YqaA with SNARE-associated domain